MSDDRYDLTTHDGKTVDKYTDYNLKLAEKKLGYDLTIVQGSYHKGVAASAGTHDGGGCVDLAPWDWANKVRALRELGFAAWHRPAIKGVWSEHIHAVLIGNTKLAPLAAQQVTAYRNHRDGLAGNGVDNTWHPNPIVDAAYKTDAPPTPAPTPTPAETTKTVTLSDSRITESSYLALSAKYPGELAYTGNDENGLQFVIELATGKTVGTFTGSGNNKLVDPESADCFNGALWLADVGDNDATRKNFVLYVMGEPGRGNSGAVPVEKYVAKYSDGKSHNAEAFLIHPQTGHRYIITKEASGLLFRNDRGTLNQGTTGTFRLVGSKLPAYVSEAKFTPNAKFVLCRLKGHTDTVTVLDGDSFKTVGTFKVPAVKQPESLDTDGTYVWFGSEGKSSPLVKVPLPAAYR